MRDPPRSPGQVLLATDLLSQEVAAALAQHRRAGQRQADQALPGQPPQHQLHRLPLEQVRRVEASVTTGRPPARPVRRRPPAATPCHPGGPVSRCRCGPFPGVSNACSINLHSG